MHVASGNHEFYLKICKCMLQLHEDPSRLRVGLEQNLRMFKDSKVKQTSKGKKIPSKLRDMLTTH